MNKEELRARINELLANHEYDRIDETLFLNMELLKSDNDLAAVHFLLKIYQEEKASGKETILDKTGSVEALLERYTILKFYLHRIEFGLMDADLSDFYVFMVNNRVTPQEMLIVMKYCVAPEHLDKVQQTIKKM